MNIGKKLKVNHAAHSGRYEYRAASELEKLASMAARRAVKTVYNKTGDSTMRDLLAALTADYADRADTRATRSAAADLVQAAALAVIEALPDKRGLDLECMCASVLYALTNREGADSNDDGINPSKRAVWYTALKAVRKVIIASRANHGRKVERVTRQAPETPCLITDKDGNSRSYVSGKAVTLESSTAYPIEFVSIHGDKPNAPDAFRSDVLALESADALEESAAGVVLAQACRAAKLDSEQVQIVRAMACGWTVRDIATALHRAPSSVQGRIDTIRRKLARSDAYADCDAVKAWRERP